ncbi:MAG: phosphodiester glycosidase family protein [Oscillospiraceae bacterium]|nr:phosphodiester glycosidase family protein [Oscillospiraceae bacterium]
MYKRIAALFLALCLAAGTPAFAQEPPEDSRPQGLAAISFAGGEHTYFRSHTYTPAADAAFAANTLLHGRTRLTEERVLAFQPGENLLPVVTGPSTIFGRGLNLQEAVNRAKSQGYDVIGGINAGYFNVTYMTPIGLRIRDGVLTSLNFWTQPAVGFFADGSVIFGEPNLTIRVTSGDGTVAVDQLNRVRSPDNIFLYTPDFGTHTQITQNGLQVVLQVEGDLAPGRTLTGTVTRVIEGNASHVFAAGEMVLAASTQSEIDRLAFLQEGDAVTLTVSCSDARWNDAAFVMGGMSNLVQDGQNRAASDNTRAPRTAAGVTADGTVVLYTADGRQSGYSEGLTLGELAGRMIELGCVRAFELDGGGSTTMFARLPGETEAQLVNRPSGGSMRRCADFILLCNTAPLSDGSAARLFPKPAYAVMMPGAVMDFSLLAADEHYRAVPAPLRGVAAAPDDSAVGVTDGLRFRALQAGRTEIVFQAEGGGPAGTARVTVTEVLDTLTLISADTGRVLTELAVPAGKSARLKAEGTWNRMSAALSPDLFEWTLEGDIGTLTPEGVFTASLVPNRSGRITVTGGGRTVSLPVTVEDAYENGIVIEIEPPVPDGETGELVYRLTVRDENGAPCPEITVRWNGAVLTGLEWAGGVTAEARVPMPESGLHILSVGAADVLGRRAQASDTPFFGRRDAEDSIADTVRPDGTDEWYTGYVDFLDDRGLLDTERIDGLRAYSPLRSVTRLEVMRMLTRILELDTASDPASPLPFIDIGHLGEEDLAVVRAVTEAGLVSGKPSEAGPLLDADGTMTRAELFYILYATLPPGHARSRLTGFTDTADIPAFSLRAVQTLAGMEVVSGAGGRINPLAPITRAETAALMCRFYY